MIVDFFHVEADNSYELPPAMEMDYVPFPGDVFIDNDGCGVLRVIARQFVYSSAHGVRVSLTVRIEVLP